MNTPTTQREADERAQKALAAITERLALTYRICCGTAPKQSVGELLDVTINMLEWEIVRASLTPTAPQAASQQAEAVECKPCTSNSVVFNKSGNLNINAPQAATTASASKVPKFDEAAFRAMVAIWAHGFPEAPENEIVAERKIRQWRAIIDYVYRAPAPSREADELHTAAAAVVTRWDSVLWNQEVGTRELINRLRAALARTPSREDA